MPRSMRLFLAVSGLSAVFLIGVPPLAFAATLYLSPTAKTVAVGQTFEISAEVSSPDQEMNAASGNLTFPTDKIKVIATSRANSIMNLWVQDPSFSNAGSTGYVAFQGVVLYTGFMGNGGDIIDITFKAVATGDAPISFSSGSVLANDGNGTNILEGMQNADVTVIPAPAVTPPPPLPAASSSMPTSSLGAAALPIVVAPSSSVATPTAPMVTVNGWPRWMTELLALAILLIALVIALIYSIARSLRPLNKRSVEERKELRDDLRRIEEELELDRPREEIDLSASGMRKKRERVKKEIKHLEEDLEKDTKDGA